MALEESKIKFAKEYPVAQIIEKRLGAGKKRGAEILYQCRFHNDKHSSLSVNPSKGIAKCFACGWQNDAIGFLIDMGSTFVEAVEELNEGTNGSSSNTPITRESLSKKVEWEQINNPSVLPKKFHHYLFGDPTMDPWAYRNPDGSVRGYVVRYHDSEKRKKVTIPLIFAKNGNKTDWRFQGFSTPKPLYNLDKILAFPDRTILMVEGEKTADAGTRLLDSFDKIIVTTWMGGANARLSDTDFSPLFGRKMIYWPDNDFEFAYGEKHPKAGQIMPWNEQVGNAVMLGIYEILKPHCEINKWVEAPEGSPHTWDIADWNATAQEARSYILNNMKSVEDIITLRSTPVLIPPNSEESSPMAQPQTPQSQPKPKPSKNQADNKHFRFLGYSAESSDHSYFFFRESTCKIIQMTPASMTTPNLIQLAPLRWWEEKFPASKGLSTNAVIEYLIRTSEQKGSFDSDNIRGRGAWMEGKDIIIHCGNHLIVNGKEAPLGSVNGKFLYEMGRPFDIGGPVAASTKEAHQIKELLSMLEWERSVNADLLAGWCVVAPVCGALPWRPHIWLTGAAGSGKSWVIDSVIGPLLGASCKKVQGSGSSAAGIRQSLGRDARPVVFEEADANDLNAQNKIQEVLELMRLGSTGNGADLVKGSANGKAVNYAMKSCFAFASITVQLIQRSDKTRVTVLGMNIPNPVTRKEKWLAILEKYNQVMTEEFVAKLQARTISLLPVIIRNIKTFSNAAAAELGSQRAGDQIGALLAGAYSLYSSSEVSFEKAVEWIKTKDWSEEKGMEGSKDELALLGHIMKQITPIEVGEKGKVDRTIAELLMAAEGSLNDPIILPDAANNRLKRLGIKYLLDDSDPENHIKMILISNKNTWIDKCLAGTPWSAGYSKILQRIEGARISEATRFAGTKDRAVILPFSVLG